MQARRLLRPARRPVSLVPLWVHAARGKLNLSIVSIAKNLRCSPWTSPCRRSWALPLRQVGPDDGMNVAVPAFDVCGLVAFRPAQSLPAVFRLVAGRAGGDRHAAVGGRLLVVADDRRR